MMLIHIINLTYLTYLYTINVLYKFIDNCNIDFATFSGWVVGKL